MTLAEYYATLTIPRAVTHIEVTPGRRVLAHCGTNALNYCTGILGTAPDGVPSLNSYCHVLRDDDGKITGFDNNIMRLSKPKS
jgi:hypothetical protein